jgi:hypothetical protein
VAPLDHCSQYSSFAAELRGLSRIKALFAGNMRNGRIAKTASNIVRPKLTAGPG